MKVLVTGGSGFIGTHFVDLMISKKMEVLNVDINRPKIASHDAYWKQCDIKDPVPLFDIFTEFAPTHVLHLAAKANLNGNTISDFPDNTIASQNVVNCVKKSTSIKRFILTSTQYVVHPGIYPESDEYYLPYTAYGESKAESERILRKANLHCTWAIIRPTNIWGPWHSAFPNELWKYLGKRYYVHPGFRPIKKHYGYIGNAIEQIYTLLFDVPTDIVNLKVFYITDAPIDSATWMNAFSVALSGKPIRRIPKILWRIMGIIGSQIKSITGSFPIDSDRYFRLTVQETIPYERTLAVTGAPLYSLDDGVRECLKWIYNHCPSLIPNGQTKG